MTGSSSPISSPSTIPCNSRKKRLAGRVKTVWYIRVHQVDSSGCPAGLPDE